MYEDIKQSGQHKWTLSEQASRTSNSLAQHLGNDRLLPLVTLLREEGARLVAEGVEVPVPPPPKGPPIPSMGSRAWSESVAQDRYEALVLPLADDEDDGVIRLS
jgi:hypothetical protein